MALAGSLVVDLTLKSAQFVRDLGKATNNLNASAASMNRSLGRLESGFKSAFRGASIAAAVTLVTASMRQAFQSIDAIAKLSDKLNLSAEETQRWAHAARSAGVEGENLSGVFDNLNKSLGQAARGDEAKAAAFEALGIKIRDSRGQIISAGGALLALSDALVRSGGSASFAASATEVAGKSWTNLASLLKKGSAGIQAAKEDLDRLGAVLSEDTVRGVERANEAMGRLWTRITAGAQSMWAATAPILEKLAKGITPPRFDEADLIAQNLERIANLQRIIGAQSGVTAGRLTPRQIESFKSELAARQATVEALKRGIGETRKSREEEVRRGAAAEAAAAALLKLRKEETEINKRHAETAEILTKIDEERAEREAKIRSLELEEEKKLQEAIIKQEVETAEILIKIHEDEAEEEARVQIDRLKEIKDSTRRAREAVRELGLAFSSAFEDAVIGGKKTSDILRSLAQDMLRIGLRKLVTEPLFGAVSDSLGGLFSEPSTFLSGLEGLAHGGQVIGGKDYLVGERGAEIFRARSGGEIIPMEKALGGDTYYIDARNADRAGLARLEKLIHSLNASIEPRSVGAVMDAQRRGVMA